MLGPSYIDFVDMDCPRTVTNMDQKNLKKKTLNLKVKALETKTAPLMRRAATSPVIGSS